MRVALPTRGLSLAAKLAPCFGRAEDLIIYHLAGGESLGGAYVELENHENMDTAHCAGVHAAREVAACKVDAVVTRHCGPRVFDILSGDGIEVFTGARGTAQEAIEAWRSGKLKRATEPDVRMHWSQIEGK